MGNKTSSRKDTELNQEKQFTSNAGVPTVYSPPIPKPFLSIDSLQSRQNVRTCATTDQRPTSLVTYPLTRATIKPFPSTIQKYGSEPIKRFEREPIKRIDCPNTYYLWEESFKANKIKPGELDSYNTRIDEKSVSKKAEATIFNIKLERLQKTNEHYTSLEPKTPLTSLSLNAVFSIQPRLDSLKKYTEFFFPTEVKKPELTPEILEVVEHASRPYPADELLSEIDGAEIRRKDIATLRGLNWLNDEVVNAYMNLLVARGGSSGRKKVFSFNTFFYPKLKESGYNSIRRWTRKVDIFNFDFITVPVHLGNHWCLAFIDFTQRKISYYDSLGGQSNGCCDILLDYLRDESKDKKKKEFDDENWNLINAYSDGIPQQSNGSDCGVFACTYAEYLTRRAKLTFGQEDMPYFRKKMIYELVEKKILE